MLVYYSSELRDPQLPSVFIIFIPMTSCAILVASLRVPSCSALYFVATVVIVL